MKFIVVFMAFAIFAVAYCQSEAKAVEDDQNSEVIEVQEAPETPVTRVKRYGYGYGYPYGGYSGYGGYGYGGYGGYRGWRHHHHHPHTVVIKKIIVERPVPFYG